MKAIDKSVRKRLKCDPGDVPAQQLWSYTIKTENAPTCHHDVPAYNGKRLVHRRRRRPLDAIHGLEIDGLKSKYLELQKLVDMLLVLVDPQDVQAALRIDMKMPSDEELQDLGSDFTPPAELLDEDWGID